MSEALPVGFVAIPRKTPAGAVLAGFSGGLDSCVLLHLLATQPAIRARGLRAIHVHHGLQADADAWAVHCRAVCDALGVPLQVVRVEVDRDGGSGLEAAARDARRRAFAEALADDEVLALAHHCDDQAETFLMRALRASGPDGLAAMRPWRRFGQAWLWRPLLAVPRAELLQHARRHGLHWIEDTSNADLALDRNFLRHRVLPLLRERWPRADAAFARAAELSADAHALLADGDTTALATVRTTDPRALSIPRLASLPAARRARVLRHWIAGLGLPPLPAQGVAAVESWLMPMRSDAAAEFAWHGAALRRWRELLHADVRRAPLPADFRAEWNGDTPLRLPTGDALALTPAGATGEEKRGQSEFRADQSHGPEVDRAKLHSDPFFLPFTVHARGGGERITLPGRRHSHALKHVLQDLGVPPWLRERLPLLSDADGALLAAGDLVYSAGFEARLRTAGARLLWTAAGRDHVPDEHPEAASGA